MKPLEGITVLEFSTMITASFAAMMMADQGARVIKVEPMEAGDPMRYIGTQKGGMSGLFANCNRGKESVEMDLKDERAQEIVRDLATSADVVIHNFRPGVMDKLGLGSDVLREKNPKLIVMAISGFGADGPMSSAPAYDPVIQAQTGMSACQGAAQEGGGHEFIRNLMCDKITAYTACQAVTSALFQRERTGEGQHIDLSMIDSGLFFMFPDAYMNHTLLDDDREVQPLLADLMYQMTETKDGAITMSAATDEQRNGSLKAVEMDHLMADERFDSLPKLLENFEEFRGLVADAYKSFTTDEVLERLRAHDVPCAKSLSLDEVLVHPQIAHNKSVEEIDHPHMGKIRQFKSPARFGGEVLSTSRPTPLHGEDTVNVLKSAGLDDAQIKALQADNVVGDK